MSDLLFVGLCSHESLQRQAYLSPARLPSSIRCLWEIPWRAQGFAMTLAEFQTRGFAMTLVEFQTRGFAMTLVESQAQELVTTLVESLAPLAQKALAARLPMALLVVLQIPLST